MILWNQPHELQTFHYSGGRKFKCPKILPHDMHVFQYPWGPNSKCPKILPHAKHVFQYPGGPKSKCPKFKPHAKQVFQYSGGEKSSAPNSSPTRMEKPPSRGASQILSPFSPLTHRSLILQTHHGHVVKLFGVADKSIHVAPDFTENIIGASVRTGI